MTTLVNGDLWSESLANASLYPISDGNVEVPGHGPKVIDNWLSDEPDQIKARVGNYLGRVQVKTSTGLSVIYSGAPVLKSDGTLTTVTPGSLSLPNSSTVFIFINSTGVVAQSTALPRECVPLAIATTVSGQVTQLLDIRDKAIEQIKPFSLPPATSPWLPGDTKATFRNVLEPGFLWADGTKYNTADYPALYAAIGRAFTWADDTNSTFRVPDLRGRTLVGAGQGLGLTNKALGDRFGTEAVQLSVSQMPSHNHGVNDAGHNHSVSDPGHNHSVSDPGHGHNVYDPGHSHALVIPTFGNPSSGGRLVDGDGPAGSPDYYFQTQGSLTGIGIYGNGTGVSIQPKLAGVSINSSGSGLTINSNGANAPISLMQPSTAVNYMIRSL